MQLILPVRPTLLASINWKRSGAACGGMMFFQ
jgi:hypothetical protein